MQLFAGDTNALGEQGFDVHMNIFQAYRPVEFAGDDLRADFLQPLDNLIPLGLGQDADLGQHGGVGDGAVDVVVIQALVKTDGCSKAFDKGISRFGGASARGIDGLLVLGDERNIRYSAVETGGPGQKKKAGIIAQLSRLWPVCGWRCRVWWK